MDGPTFSSLGGGILIGVAATLLLGLTGRIAGNSGILAHCAPGKDDGAWRVSYLVGLVSGAAVYRALIPGDATLTYTPSFPLLVLAGLLVGFGTRLGGGCTSGHGVCGIGRLSRRSIAATAVFMAVSMLTVLAVRLAGGVWW